MVSANSDIMAPKSTGMKKLSACAQNPSAKAKAAAPNSDYDAPAPKRGKKPTAKCLSKKVPILEDSSDDGGAEKRGSDSDGVDDKVKVKWASQNIFSSLWLDIWA